MISEQYYKGITHCLETILKTQKEKMEQAAKVVADVIKQDGIIYMFGCGHSHLIALDNFYRAGGLVNVSAVLDTDLMLHNGAAKSSAMERMEGIMPHVLKRYCITPKDVLFVISTSGINGAPVDAAKYAKEQGIPCITVSSMAYKKEISRHSSGKHLYDFADVSIDNCVPHGDAVMHIDGIETPMGSVSTAASSFITQSVLMEGASLAAEAGAKPPVYLSGNIEGGAEFNKSLIEAYLPRVKHL